MAALRGGLAALFRAMPRVRGKARLGAAMGRLLTCGGDDADCIDVVPMRDGTRMVVDVRCEPQSRVYWTGEYDGPMVGRLAACLQPGWTVLDVGANVGFYSVALGNRLKALGGVLHAFEPVPANYSHLMRSVALNELDGVVIGHAVALGDREDVVELVVESDHASGTGNAVIRSAVQACVCEPRASAMARITPLDAYALEAPITACHLVKVDVEGAEVLFVRGASRFLGVHRPLIYGEFNRYWMGQFGHSLVDVARTVCPWGYRLFRETRPGRFVELAEAAPGIEDVLMCPSETSVATLRLLGVAG